MNKKRMLMNLKTKALLATCALLLGACTSTPNRAPVEDRGASSRPSATAPAVAPADAAKPLPGAENAGKPGYYSVKPGDTLIRIGLENGQNWKDLVKWNGLDNPNIIEVGQVLRVLPPGVDATAASSKPVTTARVETRPLDPKAPAAAASASTSAAPSASSPIAGAAPAPSTTPAAPRDADDDVNWAWPTAGAVITPFEEGKTKGVSIGGKPGDPVYSAADGRVIYAGSGLRGYGNLIILKHNSLYLTTYAHNQALFVKEDQAVRRGQKIAEVGSTDAESVRLYFEIRRQGKPVDPVKLLPPR